jgi:hypothetical protein
MKKDYTITALLICFGLAVIFNLPACYQEKKGSKEVEADSQGMRTFSAGEILLPDYVHDDTLIVINPKGLNREIQTVDETDSELSAILYKYCAVLGQTQPDYGLNVDNIGYKLTDYSYNDTGRVKWGANFDSLIYNWND